MLPVTARIDSWIVPTRTAGGNARLKVMPTAAPMRVLTIRVCAATS